MTACHFLETKGMKKVPTKTYFNLSEEKQSRLITAAAEEFARVPLNEASINNIIKKAEISRGSFYQYFADKEDLYYYYLSLLKQDTQKMLLDSFKKAKGNLFEGYRLFFPTVLTLIMDEEHSDFFKHMFLHMDYRTGKEVTPDTAKHLETERKSEHPLKKHIDMEKLKLTDPEDFSMLIKFLMTTLFGTIGEGFYKKHSREEIISAFNKKMDWIEYGLEKN